jgi:biotin carboxylase
MRKTTTMRIAVLDCFTRMGMSVVEALDPSYELVGGAAGSRGAALRMADSVLRSPRLTDVFDYPPANVDPDGFAAAVLGASERYCLDAVFPASTASAHGLSLLRHERSDDMRTTFVVDDYERLVQLADKWRLYELCTRLGVPAPRTVLPVEGAQLNGSLGYPVVVKPRMGEGSRGMRVVRGAEELNVLLGSLRRVGARSYSGHPYIVQRFVPGEIHNVAGCSVEGRPLSLMTQRRVLTRLEVGGSGFVHTTTWEPELLEYGRAVIEELGWTGPLLLEFLKDSEGAFHLIDGNPRVWSSTTLTVAAGMNVCQQAVDVFVLGRTPEAITDYRVGLTIRWVTPGAIVSCFRRPRRPRAVWGRLGTLLAPRRPSSTLTDLRFGSFRHFAGIVLRHALVRAGARRSG